MTTRTTPTSSFEIIAIIAICFGYMMLGSLYTVMSGFPAQKFSDDGLQSLVLLELILASVAIVVLRMRGYAVAELIPQPSGTGSFHGVLLWVVALGVGSVAMALFPKDQQMQLVGMMGKHALGLLTVFVLSVVNGLYEEVFLLGYLQRELMPHGAAFAVGASLLVRVLYHTYQGHVGATGVLVMGLVFGLYFLQTRSLWPPVLAHILADMAALA